MILDRKIIIANWKMNPMSLREAEKLAKESDMPGLVIAPPSIFLETVGRTLHHAKLGAQNVFWEKIGPYTGEVSASQLKKLNVGYCIVGHSERRACLQETNAMIGRKVEAVLDAGLIPVLCVGEGAKEKKTGKTKKVLEEELRAALSECLHRPQPFHEAIVVYEPVWAISTNPDALPDTPENMVEIAHHMTKVIAEIPGSTTMRFHIMYGGSVTSKNAEEFLKQKEVAGLLVGSASLKSEEIKQIVRLAEKHS